MVISIDSNNPAALIRLQKELEIALEAVRYSIERINENQQNAEKPVGLGGSLTTVETYEREGERFYKDSVTGEEKSVSSVLEMMEKNRKLQERLH